MVCSDFSLVLLGFFGFLFRFPLSFGCLLGFVVCGLLGLSLAFWRLLAGPGCCLLLCGTGFCFGLRWVALGQF